MSFLDRMERVFFWLSGASSESLDTCPAWERRKYVAFGATVLVPCSFAAIASSYAISTLTNNWFVIAPIALVWSLIILTVDRALLAIYRAYQSVFRTAAQFGLRIVVAALMGITISHPLTLLLFRDTISSVVEKERQAEIDAVRVGSAKQKALVETRVKPLEDEIARQRELWDATFTAKFLDENGKPIEKPLTEEEQKAKAEREAKIAEATGPIKAKLDALDAEMATQTTSYQKIAVELNHWQTEFEREVNGQRSGIIGLGPRAKSIQEDQLTWRRAESARLSSVLDTMTQTRVALVAEMKAAEDNLNAALDAKAAEEAERLKTERDRIDSLRRQVQQDQANEFVGQQNAMRATLKAQIDALLAQLGALHAEVARLTEDEETRVNSIRTESRRDILTQTLALHHLFDEGKDAGRFALTAYLVLTLLFMLVDTIPLVVKFFSKAGPYDSLVDCDEARYDRERRSFLTSFNKYMDELASGRLLHLTQSKPLERALIEGVDRSRAAKEFLEHLMELERSFEEKIRVERERASAGGFAQKAEVLEDMARTFYSDLRERMESFFGDGGRRPATGQA